MAEVNLTLTLTDLRDAVGHRFYGVAYASVASAEQTRINGIINDGLRQFRKPPRVMRNGRPISHDWSFFNKIATISHNAPQSSSTVTIVNGVVTLASGTWPSWAASGVLAIAGVDYTVNTRDSGTQLTLDDLTLDASAGTTYTLRQDDYDLPDDFGQLHGDSLTYEPAQNNYFKITVVDEGRIREERQNNYATSFSYPFQCAVRPKSYTAATGQRHEIMFWPGVTQAATVTYAYQIRSVVVSNGTDYPHGASDHGDTIKAAVMAQAEFDFNEERGVLWQDFLEKLQASIDFDVAQRAQHNLGHIGGDGGNGYRPPWGWNPANINYTGV